MKCTITLIKTRNFHSVWRLWETFGIAKVYNLTHNKGLVCFRRFRAEMSHVDSVVWRRSLKNRVHHQVKILKPLSHGGETPELTRHKSAHPVWPVSRAILSRCLHILILCLFHGEKTVRFFFQIYSRLHGRALILPYCPSGTVALRLPVLNADRLRAVLLVPLSLLSQSSFNHTVNPTHCDLLAPHIHRHPL